MANQERRNRDLKPDQNQDRDGRSRENDVARENKGDGTDSGGTGYREQQFPGQGRGEIKTGHERGHRDDRPEDEGSRNR
jgi:hypothetical protein